MAYNVDKNQLHTIAMTSMVLGGVAGTGLILVSTPYSRLGLYLLFVAAYHLLEFINTSTYQPQTVTLSLFLLYGNVGSKEYLLMQLVSIWEYFFIRSRWLIWPYMKHTTFLGMGMATIGLYIRHRAMMVCGNGFSHYIQTTARHSHTLVTHDIYGWSRHPSYLGFYLWAIGLQMCLSIPLSLVLTIVVITWFFRTRVAFEEWFLVNRLFGQQYTDYSNKVGTLIPFV